MAWTPGLEEVTERRHCKAQHTMTDNQLKKYILPSETPYGKKKKHLMDLEKQKISLTLGSK